MRSSNHILYQAWIILFVIWFSTSVATAKTPIILWQLNSRLIVDDEAWNWNCSSWDQEKIATFGDFQYTVYWDDDQVMVLARRNICDDSIQKLRLPQCTLTDNDPHRNTCLGISAADGRLHLCWDHHADQMRYAKSRIGFLTDPSKTLSLADIEAPQSMLADPKDENYVTYPRFIVDKDKKLYCFYRIGSSGDGDNVLNHYDPKTATWKRVGMVFNHAGTYEPWNNSKSRCAYLHDLLFDKTNRLHATWVYRETHKTWASNHDLHYAYSDDEGLTWHNNSGHKIADLQAGDPITLDDPGLVVVKIPVYSWIINTACMSLDSQNRPHVVTFRSMKPYRPEKLAHQPPDDFFDTLVFVHYWRGNNGIWHGGEPIEPGAKVSRPDIVFDTQDTMYFFWSTLEGFRCLRASAQDSWKNWTGDLLTGPDFTGTDTSKHDRTLWLGKGILSFTAKPKTGGFAILDFTLSTDSDANAGTK